MTKEIESRIGEIIGEASMCWSETPTGVFESTHANKLVAELTTLVEEARREAWEEAIRLSDEIEWAEPDGGTSQWIAFKRFRNTLRDYLQALTPPTK